MEQFGRAKVADFHIVVERAALACIQNSKGEWKKHPHQHRRTGAQLRAAADALLKVQSELKSCRSFEALYRRVKGEILVISGIGVLTAYDTSLRIGHWLGLEPEVVYLHAGAKDGAKAIGLNVGKGSPLPLSVFPSDLVRSLSAAQVENMLCVYKACLRCAASSSRACWLH